MTFIDILTDILGCTPSANITALIFGAFVLFGLFAIVTLVRGAFRK